MLWVEMLQKITEAIVQCLVSPFFWVVVGLVAVQNRRIAKNRNSFFGLSQGNTLKDTLYAAFLGILGGFLGSTLLVITGVSLDGIGIGYIWPLAVLLMLISPRFLCFAYSGGIIALSSALLGFPRVQVPQLMALVAILHFVESFLILVSGHMGATPIYTKDKKSNTIVGGFTLQKFWPIPIVVITLLNPGVVNEEPMIEMLNMPQWWPLLKPYLNIELMALPALLPVIAALGYGDLAVARTPGEKSKISARNLSIYSLILLGLALVSSKYYPFQIAAALFAPLGHELIILIGQKMETVQKPVFTPPSRGLRVLDTVSNTAAEEIGLKPGDVIYSVNGNAINSTNELEAIIQEKPWYLEMEYVSMTDNQWYRRTIALRTHQPFGLIPVPRGNEQVYMELKSTGLLQKMWHKLTK